MKLRLVPLAMLLMITAGCPYFMPGDEQVDTPAETAAVTAPPVVIPAGVAHVDNPDWVDMETPTDVPEVSETAATAAVTKAKKAHNAARAKPCKSKNKVYKSVEGSRAGYVSYKNKELPVSGVFESAGVYFVTGKYARMEAWADVTSLDSGDEARDAKLKKLFFEVEKAGNGLITFKSTSVTGLDTPLPTEEGAAVEIEVEGQLTMHGKSAGVLLPMTVTRMTDHWEAKLDEGTLVGFEPFGLIEPLNALMKSCNHKAMGSSAVLDVTLKLQNACK